MKPSVEPLHTATDMGTSPSVLAINYQSSKLRVQLSAGAEDEGSLLIVFKRPEGFRVLDEGDLLEFWESSMPGAGWLYLVHRGGWNDLESTRDGYLSRHKANLCEYLIIGKNECVSVLCRQRPEIVDTRVAPSPAPINLVRRA